MIGHTLNDPWASHPVANRHICYGGGGGDTQAYDTGNAPDVPDYTKYIESMTGTGEELKGYGADLMKWAKEAGIKVSDIADTVSKRASGMADQGAEGYKSGTQKWKDTYGDIYEAQAADAKRMIGELPRTEEQYAGKYQADVAQAFDASKQANDRSLRSYGLKAPGSGGQQLDAMVSNQRGLAQVAAGEQGRLAARTEARDVAEKALGRGRDLVDVAQKDASIGLSAGNQEIGAPESAISTTASAYTPGTAAYNAAYPWMKQWGDTTATSYNQGLAGYSASSANALKSQQLKAEADASSGDGGLGALAGLAGTVAGSFMGPVGGAVGGAAGSAVGKALAAKGGYIDPSRRYAEGGEVEGGDQMVTPDMSQSEGAITDDVPARLNVGEFVIPKDVVEWLGEEKLQNIIVSARKKREQNTVAEPEMGPASAIDAQAPQFQSEGTV
jgi:hypothetical protein